MKTPPFAHACAKETVRLPARPATFRKVVAMAGAALLLTLAGTVPCPAADAPPNVVIILSDDQGWGDYGFMGHPVVRTSHLDALAARSLVYERGYVVSPLCRPSLASIATGLHPHEHGVVGNDVSKKDTTRYRSVHEWDRAPVQLFDLDSDPGETADLSPQHPELVERFHRVLDETFPPSPAQR